METARSAISGARQCYHETTIPQIAEGACSGCAGPLESSITEAPVERRRRIIRAEPQLRERELLRYDRLSDAIRAALLDRGAAPREALLVGKLSALAFELSLEQWLETPGQRLIDIIDITCTEIVTGS